MMCVWVWVFCNVWVEILWFINNCSIIKLGKNNDVFEKCDEYVEVMYFGSNYGIFCSKIKYFLR